MTKNLLNLVIILTLSMIMAVGLFSVTASAASSEYTITYHLDGGTNALKNPDVYTSEDVISLQSATKNGYTFDGWFLDQGKTIQITEISNRTGSLNLYAKFTPKSFTVEYNDGLKLTLQITKNSTTTTKEIYLPYGTTIDPYSASFLEEHTNITESSSSDPYFSGWYINGSKLNSAITLKEDTTLTCDFNNKKTGSNYIVYEGTSKRFEGSQIPSGFFGYRVPTVGTGRVDMSWSFKIQNSANHSVSIYNRTQGKDIKDWSSKYNVSGGSTGDYVTFYANPGDIIQIYVYSSYGIASGSYFSINGNYRKSVSVIAEKTISETVYYDQQIATPTPTDRYGYNFLGWYDTNGNKITSIWKYLENKTFAAKLQPTKYYISYSLNGGTNSLSNPSTYTIEDSITLSAPSKPGYTFKGWYSDSKFTKSVTSISNQTGNITLYAKYEVNNYNLTLDGSEGSWAPKVTFVSNGKEIKSCYLNEKNSISAFRPDNRSGYIFGGWYLDSACTNVLNFNRTITDDIVLYAKWISCSSNTINAETIGSIDITINGKTERLYAFVPLADGKVTVSSLSSDMDLYGILYDSSKNVLISSDDISSSDLNFSYSYDVKAGQLYYIAARGNTSPTVGSAKINIVWTGSYAIKGTTYLNRQTTVEYDTNYTLPPKPIREGYIFLGWYDENGTQITGGLWNFTSDKTLTAKWEAATYHTVTFKDLNGEVISTKTYYYSQDIIAPELPTKAEDAIGSYTAKWDNNYSGVCTGDAVYSPVFEITYKSYIVRFKNWDGTTLSTKYYHYGDTVVIPSATPTRASDNTYTYTFKGWDKEVIACAGSETYTATYNANYIDYTVIFKDEDGTVLSETTYHYGDTVAVPQAPTKEADKTYTYTFGGWDKTVVKCMGNTTYTATYNAIYIDYTIIFKNADGTTLSTKTYHYGDKITVPQTPTKIADKIYTYTFGGWDKTVVNCDGDATYTATYTPVYIEYTIVFKDYDGKIISSKTYHYGDAITIPANPTRNEDVVGSYTFAGWDKTVVNCAGDTTYTATYSVDYTDYTVVFKNYNGTVISTNTYHYGDTVSVPSNPTKPADQTYTYTFKGWDMAVVNCNGNAVYTATYNANYINYTVIFKNDDGTVLSEKTYHYNDKVTVPNTPIKAADKTYTYTFAGWDKEVVNCDGNATYTATYNSIYIDYTVIFKDEDGTILSEKTYHYGDKVTVPATPTKVADNIYTYAFKSWNKAVVNCAGDATYIATYTSTYIDYTVIFKNENGTVLSTKTYHYGDKVTAPATPTKVADNTYTYTFAGWDKTVVNCAGDTTYTATYTPVYIEYTVVFKDYDGTVISIKNYHYGEAVTKPSNPVREADNTYTYVFSGWDNVVTACTESVAYTATYSSTYIEYEIVFKNYNGTILSSATYHYGDIVTVPKAPTKPADESYTYEFAGWDSEVTPCFDNKVYTAKFNSTNIEYTVEFKDYNGEIISSEIYHFSDEIVVPADPTRKADNTYTYSFKKWDKTVTACTGNAIYTAVYDKQYIDYTITFLDWDGSVIETVVYHYGKQIVSIADPERESDETYSYAFASWNKELGICTGNAKFTAVYDEAFINYTVVFNNYDGSVISRKTYHFGDKIDIPSNPIRLSDNTYSYTFKAWGDLSAYCNGNKAYTAEYEAVYIDYTVEFKDYDGEIIDSKIYHYGDSVVAPSNPTREADKTYTYTFAGWDKEVVACEDDATYIATYTSINKNIEVFNEKVVALVDSTISKELYGKIYEAIQIYCIFNEEEKQEVEDSYQKLLESIEAYNAEAEVVNAEHEKATEIAFAPLSSMGITFIAAIYFLLKRKFFI